MAKPNKKDNKNVKAAPAPAPKKSAAPASAGGASTKDITATMESKMQKSIHALSADLAAMRSGRATPALLDKVMVECYGSMMPINQAATVTVPEPRMIVITPWDKSMLKAITKAIQTSELGLNPNSDGVCIRLNLPQMTEDRRKEMVKMVKKKVEEYRVVLRNLRRDANDAVKKLEKAKEITEDESKEAIDGIQKTTDKLIKELDAVGLQKEKEVMEI